jgi:hypothetical protein
MFIGPSQFARRCKGTPLWRSAAWTRRLTVSSTSRCFSSAQTEKIAPANKPQATFSGPQGFNLSVVRG